MKFCLKEAINASVDIMRNGNIFGETKFSNYCIGYFGTTEDIKSYLNDTRFNKNKALTVLSSGDQVFNLICKRVEQIDAFDINRLQYYVYYLRRAMILSCSLGEFMRLSIDFISSRDMILKRAILDRVKRYLPEDVYEYYRKLLEAVDLKQGYNLSNLYKGKATFVDKNIYLESYKDYEALQKRLNEVEVRLHFGNAKYITYQFDGDYDIILLSNIADYFGTIRNPMKLCNFEKFIRTYYEILAHDGVLINYLYLNDFNEVCMGHSNISNDDLGEDNIYPTTYDDQAYLRIRKK